MPIKLRFGLRKLLLVVAVLAALLGVGRWVYLNWDEYTLATLPCGEGRKIIITAPTTWEVSQPILYQVIVDGKIAVPKYCFYGRPPHEELQIRLVSAEDGNLVGVVLERDDSRNVLILHDFATSDSWPAVLFYGSSSVERKKLLDAFERLRIENRGLRLGVRD